MEDRSCKKKSKRKIRSTQEFNKLNRQSDMLTLPSLSEKKTVTKKKKNHFYLPQIDFNLNRSKENCSPNICVNLTKKTKKTSSTSEDQDMATTSRLTRSMKKNSETSNGGESDPEIKIKNKGRKKKKHKEKYVKKSSSEDSSESEYKHNIHKAFQTPLKSDELSDDIFSSQNNLYETLQLPFTPEEHNRNTFELESSTFNTSELPVVEELNATNNHFSSNYGGGDDKRNRSSRYKIKRSTSLGGDIHFSNKKLKSVITPKRSKISSTHEDLNKTKSLRKTSMLNKPSLNTRDRKSVVFCKSELNERKSLSESVKTKLYPKSPHVSKISNVSTNLSSKIKCNSDNVFRESLFSDENDCFSEIESVPTTSSATSFSTNVCVSEKKSVSFLSPINNEQSLKRRFNDSPFVKFLLDTSGSSTGTSTDLNATFDIMSPTHLKSLDSKRNSIMSPLMPSLSESVIDIASPSPDKVNIESINENSSENSKLERKITKRKRWNKSIGVSILDHSGMSISFYKSPEKFLDLSPIKPAVTESVNNYSVTVKDSQQPSTSKQTCKNSVKRTKLPNFAAIHQRAFERMENVKELNERKAARARQLLSGKKPKPEIGLNLPTSNLKVKSPTLKIKSPKSKKLLRYTPKKYPPPETLKKIEPVQSTSSSSFGNRQVTLIPSKSNPKVIDNQKKTESRIPKPSVVQKKGLSKLGFKTDADGNNKLARQDQMKAVANKTKLKRNSLDAKRIVIQNVRTNRRFDLLMKMRNTNK